MPVAAALNTPELIVVTPVFEDVRRVARNDGADCGFGILDSGFKIKSKSVSAWRPKRICL